MKMMKTFDCQDMPGKIRENFFEYFQDRKGNDVYVSLYIDEVEEYPFMEWLIDEGGVEDEKVLVKHWW
jgi:hypothetical protein